MAPSFKSRGTRSTCELRIARAASHTPEQGRSYQSVAPSARKEFAARQMLLADAGGAFLSFYKFEGEARPAGRTCLSCVHTIRETSGGLYLPQLLNSVHGNHDYWTAPASIRQSILGRRHDPGVATASASKIGRLSTRACLYAPESCKEERPTSCTCHGRRSTASSKARSVGGWPLP